MHEPNGIRIHAPAFHAVLAWALLLCATALAGDLPEVKKCGVLRHLGIPYANFVTGDGDGMDVELLRLFARSLGVRYEYVKTSWDTAVEDLIGRKVEAKGGTVELLSATPVKGDLIANGFTVLPWRRKVVDFSDSTFPSQIWLVARADSKLNPIKPSGAIDRDIQRVKGLLKGRRVLALKRTCLDPDLYGLYATGAEVICFNGNLNELAPAILNGEAEMTILDVPDALVALEKWAGKIKVIGPVSPPQVMAVAFPQTSVELREAFNRFLAQSRRDGSYERIVRKYYPTAFASFPEYFKGR
ncbi:MAG: transporter substrate-binding domain-containing protein [Geothrix sp.]|nr:transporter substrate-binding domain-containing protein [Geothrix sp.]